MSRYLSYLFCLIALSFVAGCNSAAATNQGNEGKMRDAYQKKSYSINDVPPSQRAIVEGYIKGTKNGQAPPAPPAKK